MNLKTVIVVGGSERPCGAARRGANLTALELVANRPIVHHVLDRLRSDSDAGFIFAGDADPLLDLRAGLTEYVPSLERVEYVVSDRRGGVAGALAAAAPLIGEAACLVQPADGLLDEPVSPLLETAAKDRSDLMLLVSERYSQMDVLGRVYDEGRPGCDREHIVDAALFAPGALGRSADHGRLTGDDLEAVGRRLAAWGVSVRREPVESWHRYSGSGAELLNLNRVALDRTVRAVPASLLAGNQIDGNVRIDPTAFVQSSTVVGPTVIGPGATVTDAYIGPYTSIGAGARIQGAEIERSIISPGASVLNVGSRLTSSLVGRGTRVFRDFSLPRAVRLWVGEGDEVALC
ncbi:MAG TPA: NDP-sugar synthase [Solirubrobacteraceae bacterium]